MLHPLSRSRIPLRIITGFQMQLSNDGATAKILIIASLNSDK